jgi:heme/copper-type cytochrome/quinol oxidase subunit 4
VGADFHTGGKTTVSIGPTEIIVLAAVFIVIVAIVGGVWILMGERKNR